MKKKEKTPKVFISYCWNGQEKKEKIDKFAHRLAADGVEIVADIYRLKVGNDKFYYMEQMVNDPSISHVLIICDKLYLEKANKRQFGVGAESEIISQEIYSKHSQEKFIPIIYEIDENNEAYAPTFLKNRIYIDFSSPEKENDNWDELLRILHDKPEYVQPIVGKRPSYLDINEAGNTYEMESKFKSFRHALLEEKKTASLCRTDFFEACFSFIDSLRIRSKPENDDFSLKIIEDFKQLVIARNYLVDWCLLESQLKNEDISQNLTLILEKLLELSSRPEELNSFNNDWFYAHRAFAYECILYFIASLIKTENYTTANEIITSSYTVRKEDSYPNNIFSSISQFYYHSEYATENLPSVTFLLKKYSNRTDIPFNDITQADLVITMFSFIKSEIYWDPKTLYYASHSYQPPLFIKATQKKGFQKLLTLTGFSSKNTLTQDILEGIKGKGRNIGSSYFFHLPYDKMFNIENWDTLK